MSTPNSVYGSALSQGDPAQLSYGQRVLRLYEPALSQGDPAILSKIQRIKKAATDPVVALRLESDFRRTNPFFRIDGRSRTKAEPFRASG